MRCCAVLCFFFRTYQKSMYARTYHKCMRRRGCFPGAWSSRHLQVVYLHLIFGPSICCVPFFLVSERSGRNCLLREAPCTLYPQADTYYAVVCEHEGTNEYEIRVTFVTVGAVRMPEVFVSKLTAPNFIDALPFRFFVSPVVSVWTGVTRKF